MDLSSGSENDEENEQPGLSLTSFLFGNVDEKGQLENDFLDQEAKKHLSSLTKFGLGTILSEVISDTETDNNNHNKKSRSNSDDSTDSEDEKMFERKMSAASPTDYTQKDSSAVDFSDINELAEDLPSENEDILSKDLSLSDEYDIEDEIPASKLTTDATSSENENTNTKIDEKKLMPPPLTIPGVGQKLDNSNDILDRKPEKKLDTPLGAMLPPKYADVDVTEFFPDFRQDKVLRFSRLFGPGKFSSLPQIWRSVRRRAKKKRKEKELKVKDYSDSTSDSDEPRRCNGFNLKYAMPPPKDGCVSDDEDKLLREVTNEEIEEKDKNKDSDSANKNKVADWRFGPAQIWYDMLDVPETGDGFNYGFKMKEVKPKDDEEKEESSKENEKNDSISTSGADPIPDDAFLMVSQLHWEDDVVWDGNDIKNKVLQKLNSKTNAAGWLPSSGSRTASFSQPGKNVSSATSSSSVPSTKHQSQSQGGKMGKAPLDKLMKQEEQDDTWYSIFPVENEELVYNTWEDDVIWDAENMSKIPKPKVLTLDPNDENIILGIPDDIDPATIQQNTGPTPKVKIPHPHVKKSKILLGKAGVINVLVEDQPPPPPKSPDHDPFNISNDIFYSAKTSEATLRIKVGGGNLLQHSTPVVELRAPFIPTHMGPMKLRSFHRPPMKKYSHGTLASSSPQIVGGLLKHIKKKAKQREQERIASGGGEIFFMRTAEDLTGKDGEMILIEFCEEHPPLMNQVGMCSKLKIYYKRKPEKDTGPPEMKYGEVAYAHTSPFLGVLYPGQTVQVVENNMYRAPIYEHKIPFSDFLVIRTRNSYHIREADALFTAGQQCPLYEVPGPNSKRANNFVRDFLQVFIYRLFWKSKDNPRKIRMDDIKKAFPAHSESSIRKRLKLCADFKRTGMDSNFWVIKPDFRLPSEEEIREMVSPEQCCAYFSMVAAEQRLKDAGYGEKFIFAQPENDDEEQQMKMDDEVKVAPWNTTRAYIQAMRGKCILQLTGPADPTGCGEGFSYIRMPNKPTQNKEEQETQQKRNVTGTNADLRKLSLNDAKALLRKFGVPEEEIKKLSRWEVIDVVRTLSTEKAKAGEAGEEDMDKFSRGNRFSIAEHQERYKEDCQRIFDLQNRVLASAEVLSTDEGESTASEESEIEEWGKNLENMLANKKTSTQLSHEREEQERRELLKIMEGNNNKSKKKEKEAPPPPQEQTKKILKITRTFKNSEGKDYTRVEIVRQTNVVDAYVKIRTTKDEAFIKNFATMDEAQKEEMKREKRRIQEQLRRIKRNQEKLEMMAQKNNHNQPPGIPISLGDRNTNLSQASFSSGHKDGSDSKESSPSKKKIKMKPDLKLKCGACGQVGHMRTNKACPQYSGLITQPSLQVAVTEEQEEEIEKELNEDDEDLVNVDGTKVKLSGKLLKRHEDVKRRTLLLKVPKDAVGKGKRRRMGYDDRLDYLKFHKSTNRARTDPIVVLSSILEEVLNEMRDMPDVQPFMFPVNVKKVPDYYTVVQNPMDLQTIREHIRQRKYHCREEFLGDVNQIVENSSLYNGPNNVLTMASQRMLSKCVERLAEKEEKLMRLEKAINPLLDDDDQVALSFIFEKLVNTKLKNIPESLLFLHPVDKKKFREYYSVIHRPMDLETITAKIAAHKYHSRADFLADMQLIADNCEKFNGTESEFTKKAKTLLEITRSALEEFDIGHLEQNIALVQEQAREADWGDDESYDIETPMDRSAAGSPIPSSRNVVPTPPVVPAEPVKRSRGRPRKIPLDENSAKALKEKAAKVEDIIDVVGGAGLEAAEAMVQLSGNFYSGYSQPAQQQQDDSIDFDPNYDPSEVFLKKKEENMNQQYQSESYDFSQPITENTEQGQQVQQNFYSSSFTQSYEYNVQQSQLPINPQQPDTEMEEQPNFQQQPFSSILEDLEVSDSDEEDQKMEIFNTSSDMNTSKEDDGGLFF